MASAEAFGAWLAGHGRPRTVAADQLVTARELRDGLRAAAVRNAGATADDMALAAGERAIGRLGVQVSLLDGEPALRAQAGSGTEAVLGEVAVALADARITARWPRVKACTGEGCGFVFWDGSRNASRRWCDMQLCGSRQKMRNYRARSGPAHGRRPRPARKAHGHGRSS